MSKRQASAIEGRIDPAAVFAALGDPTRLALVSKLSGGVRLSISRLAEGSTLTRQAVTKHLHVLEAAGVVTRETVGRETCYSLQPAPLVDLQAYLQRISQQWDAALGRLRAYVET